MRRTAANESSDPDSISFVVAATRENVDVDTKRVRHVSMRFTHARSPFSRANARRVSRVHVIPPTRVASSVAPDCRGQTSVATSVTRKTSPKSPASPKSPSSSSGDDQKNASAPRARAFTRAPRERKNPSRNSRRVSSRRFLPLLVFGTVPARTNTTSRLRTRKPWTNNTTRRTSSSSAATSAGRRSRREDANSSRTSATTPTRVAGSSRWFQD